MTITIGLYLIAQFLTYYVHVKCSYNVHSQTNHAVHFGGQLTVFRNIEYFRTFMGLLDNIAVSAIICLYDGLIVMAAGATYINQKGDSVMIGLRFQDRGHWFVCCGWMKECVHILAKSLVFRLSHNDDRIEFSTLQDHG